MGWQRRYTTRPGRSKEPCQEPSEHLTHTERKTKFPGLGENDVLRERKQDLNYNPKAHSDAPIINISFLKPKAQRRQLTCQHSPSNYN